MTPHKKKKKELKWVVKGFALRNKRENFIIGLRVLSQVLVISDLKVLYNYSLVYKNLKHIMRAREIVQWIRHLPCTKPAQI